jgi:multidrug transporter EmrE-like cation transporter
MSPWIFLASAIALEVTGTVLLKLSNGFEKWQWGHYQSFSIPPVFGCWHQQ